MDWDTYFAWINKFSDKFSTNVIVGVNSVFVPESEICYIPQVCKVCQSTRDESHIVGLQVVSFRTFSEEVM